MCCSFFFFKQKTAYDMRISDWSSDVCSSDLAAGTTSKPTTSWPALARLRAIGRPMLPRPRNPMRAIAASPIPAILVAFRPYRIPAGAGNPALPAAQAKVRDRKSVVSGKRVSVRVDLGGGRIIKKKNIQNKQKKI